MDEIMDTKVVQMKFDNSQFRAGVEDTIRQLNALENSLELQGASDGLDAVTKASKQTCKGMESMADSVQTVQVAFSYLEVAGITAMVRLTNAALNYGKKIANNLWSKSIGQVIAGGKRRSQNISNAKFQLEGLGVAWNDIVDDINYGVKDTAYGLDEAATAASQLVASQVQLGEEMKTALRGISGTAAMTNSSFSEISNIFTTVASNGRLMTMQLRQLSARGLNASATIARYYREIVGEANMTEEAINQMVTRGEIDFKRFADAMDWAFGEHAKEANKTFQGALSNMNAALSRIGQKFADPAYENLRKVFIALTGDIDAINKALQPAMSAFETILNDAGRISTKFLSDEHFVKGLIALAVDFWTWVRTLLSAIQEFSSAGIYVDAVTVPFENLARSLQLYGDKAEFVKTIIKDFLTLFDLFGHGIKSALTILRPLGEALLSGIGIPLEKIKEMLKPGWLYDNKEAIKSIMDIIANFIAMKLSDVIYAIGQAIRAIDWKAVLQAVVIIVTLVTKAILLLPQLVKIISVIFKSVVVAVMVAAAAIVRFIELVQDGIRVIKDIFGIGVSKLFGITYTPTFEVHADTSPAQKSIQEVQREASETTWNNANVQTWDDVADATDNAADSAREYNQVVEETNDRIEVTDKNFRRQTKNVQKGYDDIAKAAEDSADRVEAASKTGPLNPIPDRPGHTRSPRENPDDPEIPVNPFVDKEKKHDGDPAKNQNGFLSGLRSYFTQLQKDKSQQQATKSALEIWFGGVYEVIENVAGSWWGKILVTMQKVQPILIVVIAAIGAIVKLAAPIVIAVTVIKTLIKALDAIFALPLAIGKLADAANQQAKANKYRALADMFRGMAQMLLGIAAAVGVIALAALVIKEFHLEDIVKEMFGFLKTMAQILLFIQAFAVLTNGISAIPNAINGLIKVLSKPHILTERITETHANWTTILRSMAAMFISLAAEMAVVSLSIKMLGEMDPGQLNQGLLAFALVMGTILAAILAVGIFANKFSVVTKETRSVMVKSGLLNILKGGSGGFTHELQGGGTVIHKVIGSLIIFFATVVGAVLLFGHVANKYPGVLSKGMAMLVATMIAMGAFLYGIMAGIVFLTKDINDFAGVKRNGKFMETMNRVMFSLMEIILAMSIFMGTIAIVMKSVSNLDWGQILSAGAVIVGSIGMMSLFIDILTKSLGKMTSKKIAPSYFTGISYTIMALSVFMISLAGSLALIGSLDYGKMWSAFVALTAGLIVVGAFITLVPLLLNKIVGIELDKYAKFMAATSGSISVLLMSIAGTMWTLSKIEWSNFEGSALYLAGIAGFIIALMAMIGVVALMTKNDLKAIIASSLGVFAGIAILFYAISSLFEVLDTIDLGKISGYWPLLVGVAGFVVATMLIAGALAIKKDIAIGAVLVIGILTLMFISLATMFMAIGLAANAIGDGAMKIATAIETIVEIHWEKVHMAVMGIQTLIGSLSAIGKDLDGDMIGSAGRLSLFVLLVSFAMRTLEGIDVKTAKQSADAVCQFFTTLAEGLSGNEQLLAILTSLAVVLPMLAVGITMAMLGLAIGGVGLVIFAFELVLFSQLMQQAGEALGPAIETLVVGLQNAGDSVANNTIALLLAMRTLMGFSLALIVVGTLLTVGGALMAAGAGLILLSGSILSTGVSKLIGAIVKSSNTITKSAKALIVGLTVLAAFSVGMIASGTTLTIGAALFTVASALFLVSALAISGGLVVLGKAGTSFSKSAVQIVNNFRLMVANLKTLALEAAGLGPVFAQAAIYTVEGFIQGISEGIPLIVAAMSSLASAGFAAFCMELGIASPATEMIKAAFWTVEGFIEGLTENAPGIQEVCTNIVDGVVGIFSGGASGVAAEGGNAAAGFGLNLETIFERIAPGISNLLGDIGTGWGDNLGLGLENGFKRHIQNLINYENELAGHLGPAHWTEAENSAYLREAQASGLNSNATQDIIRRNNANAENRARNEGLIGQIPTYTPLSTLGIDTDYIDVDEIFAGLSGGGGAGGAGIDTTSALASAISGSSGAGSGINDQSKAASIGGGVGNTITNSNNTYNFYQTNYSPEPLDRSAIYQQTRNQFNSFYAYAKEKNLSY